MADIFHVLHRRPRRFRRNSEFVDNLTDDELRRRYRFSGRSINRLVELLTPRLQRPTRRNQSLSPRQQVLIALRFYATGNFLQVIGDTFGIDIATVSRVITSVTVALFDLKDRAIKFPLSENHKQKVKSGFFRMHGFPSVVGLIDGTHVKILSPGQPEEAAYVNRKHQHTINVQATCDHTGIKCKKNPNLSTA